MLNKSHKEPQLEMFRIPLKDSLGEDHLMVYLAGKVDWDDLEQQLAVYYSPNKGRPAIPVRKVAGIILLKNMLKMSNHKIIEFWTDDPGSQYFCGELYLSKRKPFAAGEIFRFKRRVGEGGMKIISGQMHKLSERDLYRLQKYKVQKLKRKMEKKSFIRFLRQKLGI